MFRLFISENVPVIFVELFAPAQGIDLFVLYVALLSVNGIV
jgi:hypothetical protein